ncbi:hypothetical protein [Streptococcus sp. DD13]|uniref:hypothetical protein n=1 Tax=Streptococcus sp. DD13 TaxID=1777881 RepID=UPI0007988406|nr:hypothetical protein [Streptococcus sp. DD13]KXT79177.1 membrane protein [Streptococcus sp. DD13]
MKTKLSYQNILSFFNLLGQSCIRWGSLFLFSILLLSACLVQSLMYLDGKELSHLVPTKIWVYGVIIGIFLLLFLCRNWLNKQSNSRLFRGLSLVYLFAAIFLILLTTFKIRDDAASVFYSAIALNKGDLSSLDPGQYLFRYPHQLGLVSFERLILTILPLPSPLIFFLLNAVAVIGINFATWKTTDLLFQDKKISQYTILLSFAFLPQFFNILFVYGLLYGLCFACFGIYFLLLYRKNPQKLLALAAILALALAYWIRNNFIILLVALSIVFLFDSLRKKSWRPLLLMAAAVSFAFLLNKATIFHYETISGQDLRGTPKITWLAMGLQDDGNERRLPGWYNYYVREIYFEKKGDYQAVEEDAKKSVQDRIHYFLDHPDYAVRFFQTKFLSTWTDSLFQSIWSGPSKPAKQPLLVSQLGSLYHGGLLYRILYQYAHALLILIYAGAVFFLLFFKKQDALSHLKLYPFLYLAGGLVFHLFWETKSQYVAPYVFLLIPFSVAGYDQLVQRLEAHSIIHRKKVASNP